MNEIQRLRVLVCHPEALLAVGLIAVLREDSQLLVRSSGADVATAVDLSVDVVVTDYRGGLRMAEEAPRFRRPPRILIVTSYDREHEVRVALEAGVHGYLLLSCPIRELPICVREIGSGNRYLSVAVAQRMADSLTRAALTGREATVLNLLARGECNKSIAHQLEIGVGTVKTHVKGIMTKLKASSRTKAVSVAIQRGLVDEPASSPQRSSHFQGVVLSSRPYAPVAHG
jgi:DNA-binding NarL/FixJ family response regulator